MSEAIVTIQNYNNGQPNENLTGTIVVDGNTMNFANLNIDEQGNLNNIEDVSIAPANIGDNAIKKVDDNNIDDNNIVDKGGNKRRGTKGGASRKTSRRTNRKRPLGKGKRGKSRRNRQ